MKATIICHSHGGRNDQSQSHSTISEEFGASAVLAALLFDKRIRSTSVGTERVGEKGTQANYLSKHLSEGSHFRSGKTDGPQCLIRRNSQGGQAKHRTDRCDTRRSVEDHS